MNRCPLIGPTIDKLKRLLSKHCCTYCWLTNETPFRFSAFYLLSFFFLQLSFPFNVKLISLETVSCRKTIKTIADKQIHNKSKKKKVKKIMVKWPPYWNIVKWYECRVEITWNGILCDKNHNQHSTMAKNEHEQTKKKMRKREVFPQ